MRNIPSDLQAHLELNATTTCRLLKITLESGEIIGITNLDRDVEYDSVTYLSTDGCNISVIATDSRLSVDNGEGYCLLSEEVTGISLTRAKAGALDNATWVLYLVNYQDLSMGAAIIDAGDIGDVDIVNDTVYRPELLSYSMRLKQVVGYVDSRTCRAIFGTPAASQTGCGVDTSSMWTNGTVTGLGEDNRVFADTSLIGLDPEPFPGRVQWLTGDNTSNRLYQVEAFSTVSGTIALLEPVPWAIEVGDTFKIRRDCSKLPDMCAEYDNYINYKGEPLIPVGDGVGVLTPATSITGGFTGSAIED